MVTYNWTLLCTVVGDWYCRHRARSVSNMVTYNLSLCCSRATGTADTELGVSVIW